MCIIPRNGTGALAIGNFFAGNLTTLPVGVAIPDLSGCTAIAFPAVALQSVLNDKYSGIKSNLLTTGSGIYI